jgi:hypothetical protein
MEMFFKSKFINMNLCYKFSKMNSAFRALLTLVVVCSFSLSSWAQVTVAGGTTAAGSFTSLENALNAVNSQPATGAITITIAGPYTETAATPQGFTLGSATLNPSLSATNTITLSKTGGTVTLYGGAGGTATSASPIPDGIFKLVGADYVTIDGINFNDANVTAAFAVSLMEFGIGLFKLDGTDGCQNNTIKNCAITLNRRNASAATAPMVEGSACILAVSATPTTATTTTTPSVASGTNSYNKFYGNTLQNANYGICLNGYLASSPFVLGDTNNDIGGTTAATGNTVLNYGSTGSSLQAVGIRATNQWGVNVSYNTVNSNNGSGENHANTLYGINVTGATSANTNINNNTVTLKSGGTTATLYGIQNGNGSTATTNVVNFNNNTVTNCSYATGATSSTFYGLYNTAAPHTLNMNGNSFTNNLRTQTTVTGGFTYAIYLSSSPTVNLTWNNNTVSGNIIGNAASTSTTAHGLYAMYSFSATTNVTCTGNTVTNNTFDSKGATFYGMYVPGGANATVTGNTISNITVNSGSTATSSLYGFYLGNSGTMNFSNNLVNNLSVVGSTTGTSTNIYGMYVGTTISGNIRNNTIHSLSFTNTSTGAGTVYGLYHLSSAANIHKNKIYNLLSDGNNTSGGVTGIYVSSGSPNFYNNIVGDLRAPRTNAINSLKGIDIQGGTAVAFYNNTVNIAGTSTGTNFGSSAISMTAGATAIDLRNNIFTNNSTKNGTGLTVAVRRASTVLTNYATTSNNNLAYAGTPSATNLMYYDGTNSDQTLAAFKTRVMPREASSVTEAVTYTNTATGSGANFLHINAVTPTFVEGFAAPIALVTEDFDGEARNASTPDIGADEGVFTEIPVVKITASSQNTPTGQCVAVPRTISVSTAAGSGPITSVNMTYTVNGGTPVVVPMTGGATTGTSTWTATIPVPTPGNAAIVWSASAGDALATKVTGSTSYVDEPLTGVTALATATPATICAGETTSLNVVLSNGGAGPTYTAPPAVSNPIADEDLGNITITSGATTILNNTTPWNSLVGTIGTAAGTVGSYSNFTAFGPYVMNVGQTYNYSVTSNQNTATFSNSMAIYIDFNRNGVFTDAGEKVHNVTSTIAGNHTETGSFTIPATASFGTCRMRVICNEGLITSPTQAVAYGEYEEYMLDIRGVFNSVTWAHGPTVTPTPVTPPSNAAYSASVMYAGCPTTSNTVIVNVNQLPAAPVGTNSAQCGAGIPTASVASAAGANGNGKFDWYSAASGGALEQTQPFGPLYTFYTNDFSTNVVAPAAAFAGVATVTAGGELQFHPQTNSQNGGFTVNASGKNSNQYTIDFDMATSGTAGNMADGFSYSFGSDVSASSTTPAAEQGTGSKLRIAFDSYGANPGGVGIYLMYNQTATTYSGYPVGSGIPNSPGVLEYSANSAWVGSLQHYTITINAAGQLSMTIGGTPIFTNVQLPADFMTSNKASWSHVFKSRTGGLNYLALMDNLVIQANEQQLGATTYLSVLPSTKTFYVTEMGVNGCPSPRTPVTVTVNTPPVLALTPNDGACNNDVAAIGITNPAANFDTYTWAPTTNLYTDAAASTPYTGGSAANVYFKSANAASYVITCTSVNAALLCNEAKTTTVSVLPPDMIIATDKASACGSGSVTLTAKTVASGAALQWQESVNTGASWSDVAAATGTTLTTTVSATKMFRLAVKKNPTADCILSNEVTIDIYNPQVVTAPAVTRCGKGTADLVATSNATATLSWYTSAVGGVPVGTGTTFTTPKLTSSKNYYVEASEGGVFKRGGNVGVTGTMASFTYVNYGEFVAATGAMSINEIRFLCTGVASNVTLKLYNEAGTTQIGTDVIAAIPANLGAPAAPVGVNVTLPSTLDIPGAGTYRIVIAAFTGTNPLSYQFNVPNMPLALTPSCMFTGGFFSLTGTVSSTYLNYIIGLGITEACKSPRVTVPVTVTPAPAFAVTANNVVCNDGVFPLSVTSNVANFDTYTWGPTTNLYDDAAGTTPYSGASASTVYYKSSVAGLEALTASALKTSNLCANDGAVTLRTLPVPEVSSPLPTICVSGSTTIDLAPPNAYGTAAVQWTESTNGSSFSTIPGANSAQYTTPVLTAARYYEAEVTDGAGNFCVGNTQILIDVTDPTITGSNSGVVRCGAGTVDLTATTNSPDPVRWFTAATGGQPIGTGSPFTSPIISANATYYVEALGAPVINRGGRLAPSAVTSTINIANYGVQFTTYEDITLNSIDVIPASTLSTSYKLALYNAGGTATAAGITPVSLDLPTPVIPLLTYTLPIPGGWVIPAGTYRLVQNLANPGAFVYETAAQGITYPMPFGVSGTVLGNFTSLTGVLTNTFYHSTYNWNYSAACKSPRTPVNIVSTAPPAFAVTTGNALCNNVAKALTVTSPVANFNSYTWAPATDLYEDAAASIAYSGGSLATVYLKSTTPGNVTITTTALNTGSQCQDIKSAVTTVLPDVQISSVSPSICITGSTDVFVTPSNGNYGAATFEWSNSANGTSYSPISGATARSYTTPVISSTTHYRVDVKDSNANTCATLDKQLDVFNPVIASTTGATRCGTGTVDLQTNAPSAQSVNWYTAATGGASIGTGNTFTTPVVTGTTNFYAEAVGGTSFSSGGQTVPTGTVSAFTYTPYGMFLDAANAFTITQIGFACTGTAGTATVRLYNAAGTAQIGTDVVVTIPANAGTAASPLIIDIPLPTPLVAPAPGTYRVVLGAYTGTNPLAYQFSVTNLPLAISPNVSTPGGFFSLTGTVNTTYVNYFARFGILEDCVSARQAVAATVTPAPAIAVTPNTFICSLGTAATLTASSANAGYAYSWGPATGLNSTSGASVSAQPPATTSYVVTAEDATTGCVTLGNVRVDVNPTPEDPIAVATQLPSSCNLTTELKGTNSQQPGSALLGNPAATTVNTTTTWPALLGNWYKGQRHQFIYTAAELSAIGMVATSRLDQLSMAINSSTTTTALTDYTVKVGHTTKAAFTSTVGDWVNPTTLTTVYNVASLAQPTTFPATVTIPFTAPFIWDGTSNIVVEFASCNGSASAYTTNPIQTYTALPTNQALYIFSDGTPGATVADFYAFTNANTPTATVNRSNITFNYTKPANYIWSAATGLFTNAACTVPYTAGAFAEKVYARPTTTTTYTVSAITPAGCAALNTDTEVAQADIRQIALPPVGTTPSNLMASCDDQGWTYYYDTNNSDKIFMAVNWAPTGTLTTANAAAKTAAAVESVLTATIPSCTDQGKNVYAMRRSWNVTAPAFTSPVNVRFFYDPAEKAAVEAAAGVGSTFRWFKTVNGSYSHANNVIGQTNGITGGGAAPSALTIAGVNGTDNGFTYVQFDGLPSFSGGTGAATEGGTPASKLSLKVYLNNVDPATSLMDNYYPNPANAPTNFPLSDPFATAAFSSDFVHVMNGPLASTTNTVLAVTGANAIVDWVFLELRTGVSGASTVAYTQAALIQADGDIVDVDGVSSVNFPLAPNGNYFVAIRHRNHLGFRTENKIAISPTTAPLNFTNNSVLVYGITPLTTHINSLTTNVMNGGDANHDGSLDSTDSAIWEVQNGNFNDYLLNADYNLDGSIDGPDSALWELNNGKYQELD